MIYINRLTNYINGAIIITDRKRRRQKVGKSVYSIVLSDEVVREIDRMAYENGTNRSAMINSVLAEYTATVTPEKLIKSAVDDLRAIICGYDGFRAREASSGKMVSLCSALALKYNPTLKYNVELYHTVQGDNIGELRVTLRSQNSDLLMKMADFCEKWAQMESQFTGNGDYHAAIGRFDRKLKNPCRIPHEMLGGTAAEYIKMFDSALKSYISGASWADVDMCYRKYISENGICI